MATSAAAIASLPITASNSQYLVFHNDNSTGQLIAEVHSYDELKSKKGLPQSDGGLGDDGIPYGNISTTSALTAVQLKGTLNVYGVLNGTGARPWLVCRLSPGFQLLNVKSPPLASPFGIAACSDGNNIGKLFYVGQDPVNGYKPCFLDLAASSPSPKTIVSNLTCKATSYLGAAYGAIGASSKTAYVVAQDNNNYLQLVPLDGTTTHEISGQNPAMPNTPIACVFLGNHLVVYHFDPVGTQGAPLKRIDVPNTDTFSTKGLTGATAPNGYTQLSAFIKPGSINNTTNGGISGVVILSYVESGSNQIIQYIDSLALE